MLAADTNAIKQKSKDAKRVRAVMAIVIRVHE
jgi:hypothetical protein